MSERLRWGILGTGNIAGQFAAGMASSLRGRIVAVASRNGNNARNFAYRFGVPVGYGSYEALLADKSVDAIYVSVPNSLHQKWTIAALAAGKHVLCEKPLAANEVQATEMFGAAEQAGKVLMEAFMYLSHPQTIGVMDALRDGVIGQIQIIKTSFCYRTTRIENNIRFSQELAGGAIMDVGCYCTNFALLITGEQPRIVHAVGRLHAGGVDELAAGMLQFPSGIVATFACGMTTQADNTAFICGNEGYIEIPVPWKPATRCATWTIARGTPPRQDAPKGTTPVTPPREVRTVDADRELYALEADDFAAAILDGSPLRVSPELTLNNMRALDEIRHQVGLSF